MGNYPFICGREDFFDPHSLLCKRTCGTGIDEADGEIPCDPAGVVFPDTISHLGEMERLAFHFAGSSNLAALRWLFVFGANPDVHDSSGTTLLHVAARIGSLQVVKDLVRRGLDPNSTDFAGWTPLHVSSCMGRRDVSLYLLQSGTKPHTKNGRGQTAQDICSHQWTKEIVTMYHTASSRTWGASPQAGFPTRTTNSFGYSNGGSSGSSMTGPGGAPGKPPGVGAALHFEPFFVPRDAILAWPTHREELQRLGAEIFGRDPGHGLAFLVATGAVRDYPVEINSFLVKVGADPGHLGEFLGEDFPIAQTLRLEFLNSLPLVGTGVVTALETAFHEMDVPSSWLKIDRLLRGVAHFWWRQHDEELQERAVSGKSAREASSALQQAGELRGIDLQKLLLGTETLHRLMFSTLMLMRWLSRGHNMSVNEWVQLNTGIEGDGTDVPLHLQRGIYAAAASGKVDLGRRPLPRRQRLKPALEGWAQVQYSGRAQTNSGDPAAWLDASPKVLAAMGGATSAGRSPALPCNSDEVAAGGAPTGRTMLLCASLEARIHGKQRPGIVPEATWLSLHQSLLLLSGDPEDSPPYAFVSLRHAVLKEADASERRLVLASRPDSAWPPLATGDEEWLELCLLLSDGRFQSLEAPRLELRMHDNRDFAVWSAKLGELCYDDPVLKLPGLVSAKSGQDGTMPDADTRFDHSMHELSNEDRPGPFSKNGGPVAGRGEDGRRRKLQQLQPDEDQEVTV